MNDEQKRVAYKAIDDNVEDTTARQIIRYVLECEIFRQDTISPSVEYLSKKYTWSIDTTRVAISKAKSSQFITTTGYGKSRCFELNVGFLKSKMAEVFQKTLRPVADFSDVLPNTLPNSLPNTSPNTLPNTFLIENGSTKPQNEEKEGYNNNSNNNNKSKTKVLTSFEVVSDKEERKPRDKRAWVLREFLYELFKKEHGVVPIPSSKDYFSIVHALKYVTESDIKSIVEEELSRGKKKTISEMLSTRSLNIYLQNN